MEQRIRSEMHMYLVTAMCLTVTLLHVQVEGHSVVTDPQDVDDLSEGGQETRAFAKKRLESASGVPDANSTLSRALLFELEDEFGPSTEPTGGFEDQLNRGIIQCSRQRYLPNCFWKRGYIVTAAFLTFERDVGDDMCCCACHQVNDCEAIHYETREGKCVFHQGPTLRRRLRRGTKRWVKR